MIRTKRPLMLIFHAQVQPFEAQFQISAQSQPPIALKLVLAIQIELKVI